MLKKVFRNLIPFLLIFPALSITYLTFQFIKTPLTGFQTLVFLIAATILSITVLVISTPQVEEFFLQKISGNTQLYWLTVLTLFLSTVGMIYLSISFVGAEYTQFMSQNATG